MAIRVLVADDSVVFRRAVSDALAGLPDVEVIGAAANGRLALSGLVALQPDLMTLDLEMPELNGIEVLEQMRAKGLKTTVIVLSTLTRRGGELTVRALELGAFEFLAKPEGGSPSQNAEQLRAGLSPLIRAVARARGVRSQEPAKPLQYPPRGIPAPAESRTPPALAGTGPRSGPALVLIGVSTGGPAALASLLPALPANLGAPVFIVQHMPPTFTRPLAASLSAKSAIPVNEGVDGECAQRDHAYLAPGGSHMKLERGRAGEVIVRVTGDPPENGCRPSVDYLFRSAALQFPGRSIAAILTGMGSDGSLGLRLLKRCGCQAIAQDEATCVVFGMPKEAIETGLVDVVAPLDGISDAIVRAVREVRR